MCYLFLCDCESNIMHYEDNTILYACEPNMDLVLSKIENKTPLKLLHSFNKSTFENYLLNFVQKNNQKIYKAWQEINVLEETDK